jgi:hypothetical protein
MITTLPSALIIGNTSSSASIRRESGWHLP